MAGELVGDAAVGGLGERGGLGDGQQVEGGGAVTEGVGGQSGVGAETEPDGIVAAEGETRGGVDGVAGGCPYVFVKGQAVYFPKRFGGSC